MINERTLSMVCHYLYTPLVFFYFTITQIMTITFVFNTLEMTFCNIIPILIVIKSRTTIITHSAPMVSKVVQVWILNLSTAKTPLYTAMLKRWTLFRLVKISLTKRTHHTKFIHISYTLNLLEYNFTSQVFVSIHIVFLWLYTSLKGHIFLLVFISKILVQFHNLFCFFNNESVETVRVIVLFKSFTNLTMVSLHLVSTIIAEFLTTIVILYTIHYQMTFSFTVDFFDRYQVDWITNFVWKIQVKRTFYTLITRKLKHFCIV